MAAITKIPSALVSLIQILNNLDHVPVTSPLFHLLLSPKDVHSAILGFSKSEKLAMVSSEGKSNQIKPSLSPFYI